MIEKTKIEDIIRILQNQKWRWIRRAAGKTDNVEKQIEWRDPKRELVKRETKHEVERGVGNICSVLTCDDCWWYNHVYDNIMLWL